MDTRSIWILPSSGLDQNFSGYEKARLDAVCAVMVFEAFSSIVHLYPSLLILCS